MNLSSHAFEQKSPGMLLSLSEVEREIFISVPKESDYGRLQESNLTLLFSGFHSRVFPKTKMASGSVNLNAEFELNV